MMTKRKDKAAAKGAQGGTASMLKKLQHKFIIMNMIMVASVLVVTFGAICYADYQLDYQQVRTELDHSLKKTIASVDSSLFSDPAEIMASPNESNAGGDSSGDSSDNNTNGVIFGLGSSRSRAMPIGVYQIDGTSLTLVSKNAIDEFSTTAQKKQAASQLKDAQDGFGALNDLSVYYLKQTAIDGNVYIAFTSTTVTSGWEQLAWLLVGSGVVVLIIFLIISKFFSRWALKPVEESWVQQKQFVADASHDLKTPLTVILANSAILKEHPERTIASQSQWIESTENEAKQMQGLVNDLLLLARLDEGVEVQATETVDFSMLLEGELLEFESVAFELGITLDSEVAEGLKVSGNQSRLRRLVTTLLDNACKYTPKGDAVKVTLERAESSKLRFSVNNTGSFISAEDLPHIFDRFYRTDKSRTNTSDTSTSHGLGLAIAHAIAEEHGGSLKATSDKEHGTTFIAELPLVK